MIHYFHSYYGGKTCDISVITNYTTTVVIKVLNNYEKKY